MQSAPMLAAALRVGLRAGLLGVLLVALLGGLLGAGARADGERAAREKEDPYPEEFRRRVDAAVDRGVEFLTSRQRADGSWETPPELSEQRLGATALAALACLKGGVAPSDPPVARALGYLRTLPLDRTYGVGVLLLLLHARWSVGSDAAAPPDRYGAAPRPAGGCAESMSPEDRAWMERAVKFLLDNREEGHWGYPHATGPLARWDLSNTQYALLGLWAAWRCGIDVPVDVWIEILEWVLAAQERTGPSVKLLVNDVQGDYRVSWTEDARARGFRYRPEDPVTGSMTTAGLAGLAIGQEALWSSRRFTPELRQRTRKGIRDGLAWLQENFDVTKNPGLPGGAWHHYYLYGLERAGALARCRFVGRWDWYLEGAQHLLGTQGSHGGWAHEVSAPVDTAFAVLFLRRSTIRPRQAAITPSEPGAPR